MDPVSIALGLAQFAPSVMRFFGAGEKSTAIAEQVVGLATQVTGQPNGEAALQKLREDAQLAQAFNLAVLASDTELEKAYLSDRQNARARDVALAQAGVGNRRADFMVAMDVIGLIACLATLVFMRESLSESVTTIVTLIAGQFGGCLLAAHQFEFGSSRGSKEKDDLLRGVAR